jgi:hypothetical protein
MNNTYTVVFIGIWQDVEVYEGLTARELKRLPACTGINENEVKAFINSEDRVKQLPTIGGGRIYLVIVKH